MRSWLVVEVEIVDVMVLVDVVVADAKVEVDNKGLLNFGVAENKTIVKVIQRKDRNE